MTGFVPVPKRRAASASCLSLGGFDVGVYRTIRPVGPLDSPAEADGAGLETLLLQELRAINDAIGFDYELFYWRTSDGTDAEFVLYGPRGILAFEVKRSDRYTRSV